MNGDLSDQRLDLPKLRAFTDKLNFSCETVLEENPGVQHNEFDVPGLEKTDPGVVLSVFSPKQPSSRDLPAFFFVHGGGQISGNRFAAASAVMKYFDGVEIVFITVEYRYAPEHPAPAALHDTYAGLQWAAENAARLGVHPSKIILGGGSGGAPIAMGAAMLCRNNKKSYACALFLMTPMLDDRDSTVSARQYATIGPWCGTTNRMAWDLVLGAERGGDNVSELLAPARATDLSGLPRTFIDAGECEVFRDEAVAVASVLWKCGVSTELHVWPGAYHGFDIMSQDAPVLRARLGQKALGSRG